MASYNSPFTLIAILHNGTRITLDQPEFIGGGLESLEEAVAAANDAIEARPQIECVEIEIIDTITLSSNRSCGLATRRGFLRDTDYEPLERFVVIAGTDDDRDIIAASNREAEIIVEFTDAIQRHVITSDAYHIEVQRQIFGDDGSWEPVGNAEPYAGLSITLKRQED